MTDNNNQPNPAPVTTPAAPEAPEYINPFSAEPEQPKAPAAPAAPATDEDDVDPDDQKIINKAVKPVENKADAALNKVGNIERANEIDGFINSEAGKIFKESGHAAKIKEVAMQSKARHLTVEAIAYAVAGKELMRMGASRALLLPLLLLTPILPAEVLSQPLILEHSLISVK